MAPISFPWQNSNGEHDGPRLEPIEFARQLRKHSTDAERRLWQALRNRGFRGLKFRRQHPMPPYTLDFYCEEIGVAVELDGGSHVTEEGLANDHKRTHHLAMKGIRVVRISNYEMLVHTETLLNWLWHQVADLDKSPTGE